MDALGSYFANTKLMKHIVTVGHIVLIFNTMCPTVTMCLNKLIAFKSAKPTHPVHPVNPCLPSGRLSKKVTPLT